MPTLADELTRIHRRQQHALRAQTLRELVVMFPALDWRDLDGSWPRIAVALSGLVQRQRRKSAGIASAYLRAQRLAHNLDGGSAGIKLAEPVEPERLATSLHVTTVGAAKRAARAGQQEQKAMSTALVVAAGAIARHVLNGGRETVMRSAVAMPDAEGWRRVASASGCTFCRVLAERKELYYDETVDFGAHDHCNCAAEPVFSVPAVGQSPEDYRREVADYTPSARYETPAFSRPLQRDYLADKANA